MTLADKYRPNTLDAVCGHAKSVALLKRYAENGTLAGRAYWISGATGIGKTTLARIIAGLVADTVDVEEFDSADQFLQADFDRVSRQFSYRGMGPKGGRAWIVNEAHGLRAGMIRQLLGLLERIPRHVAVIFTTTRDGQDALFEEQMDSSPLLTRCTGLFLSSQGLADPFAARALEIAKAEGLDGQPLSRYKRLVQDCKNSMRAALQKIDAGEMLTA